MVKGVHVGYVPGLAVATGAARGGFGTRVLRRASREPAALSARVRFLACSTWGPRSKHFAARPALLVYLGISGKCYKWKDHQ